MSRSGGKKGGSRAHTPEVVWLREPSPERVVRAGLCLLGMGAAEIGRVMREEPVKERPPKAERAGCKKGRKR